MKKQLILFALAGFTIGGFAQSTSNSVLVRLDTTTLKASECEWIIKSLVKNDPALTQELGRSLPQFIFGAIEKGKLRAFDPITNELIPAKKIRTWQMPSDSIMSYDDQGNSKIVVIQRQRQSDRIDQIRISHDWNLDVATGKLQSVIKWVELREKIYTAMGGFLGYTAMCRIYY